MTGTPFTWDRGAGRYRGPGGRFVSRKLVRVALDKTLENTGKRMNQLADDLRKGKVSLDEWLIGMRENVKAVHLYSTAAAKGGWDQLTQKDFGRVGRIVRDQYVYLDRFAADIAAGELSLDGRFTTRVRMYIESGRRTYYDALDQLVNALGDFDQERSVLHPADHCDQCVDQAERSWQARGEMIPIGERTCLSHCRCTKEYRNSATGQIVG